MNSNSASATRWQYVVLALLTIVTYVPIFSADFIDFDDPAYVTTNLHVRNGLTLENWSWAWTSFHASNWHPLTWLSLQLDAQLNGSRATGFHVTNVLLHLANVLLVFCWLRRLTGATGLSLTVAALFATHPSHVESVAWVSERKDVLSTVFGLTALIAYTEYVRHPNLNRYLGVAGFFAASLAAKPMWVTFPVLLLILDAWPFRRWSFNTHEGNRKPTVWWWPFVEKLPLCMLTLTSSIITILAQEQALRTLEQIPLGNRFVNAVVACVVYLKITFWPTHLAVFYPHPQSPHGWETATLCGLLLLTITTASLWFMRRCPALIMGWCWFLLTLVPVIGIVQVGDQAYADRYTYLPHIGLFIALVWGASDLCRQRNLSLTGYCLIGGAPVLTCLLLTQGQLGYWQNSEVLWRHALAVTDNNALAHLKLGTMLQRKGNTNEALRHLELAVQLRPNFSDAEFNLGNALKDAGQPTKAESHLQMAVKIDPGHVEAHQALGVVLANLSKPDEAIYHLTEATRLQPGDAGSWMNLGATYLSQESYREAIPVLTRAVELLPGRVQPLILLASAEFEAGEVDASRNHYRESLKLEPAWPAGVNRVAWNLSTNPDRRLRNGRRAVQMARRTCQATDYFRPEFLETLAAAYAESGQFDEAISTAERALKFTTANGLQEQRAAIESRLQLYRKQMPYRQP